MMNFDTFFRIIETEQIFEVMRSVRENSPYHREESVFVHTMMVCEEYTMRYSELDDDFFIGLFACLFHDVGKPACRTRKENDRRGVYYSYDGHDIVSGEIASEIMTRYGFSDREIFEITWMIEHHQIFWSAKRNDIKVTIAERFKSSAARIDFYAFKAFMLADDYGRTMDDPTRTSEETFKLFEREYLNF